MSFNYTAYSPLLKSVTAKTSRERNLSVSLPHSMFPSLFYLFFLLQAKEVTGVVLTFLAFEC